VKAESLAGIGVEHNADGNDEAAKIKKRGKI
jgi:hypothetical protein